MWSVGWGVCGVGELRGVGVRSMGCWSVRVVGHGSVREPGVGV